MRRAAVLAAGVACLVGSSCGFGDPHDDTTSVTAAPPEVTYVAIGGSETVEHDPDSRRDEAWPRIVFREHLPAQTVFADLARDGATARQARDEQLSAALELHPTLVTVWLGTRDAELGTPVEAYVDDLAAVLDGLTGAGAHVAVVVSSLRTSPYLDAVDALVGTRDGVDVVACDDRTDAAVADCVGSQLGPEV